MMRTNQMYQSVIFSKMNLKKQLCDICGKSELQFPSQRAFLAHFKNHHKKKISCTDCDKLFGSAWRGKIHKNLVHSEKVFDCASCGKTLSDLKNLKHHQKTHSEKVEISCIFCRKTLKFTMSTHIIFSSQ